MKKNGQMFLSDGRLFPFMAQCRFMRLSSREVNTVHLLDLYVKWIITGISTFGDPLAEQSNV